MGDRATRQPGPSASDGNDSSVVSLDPDHIAQCRGILGISLPALGRILHTGRLCFITILLRWRMFLARQRLQPVTGFIGGTLFGMQWSSLMGRQEAEGHSGTRLKLCMPELSTGAVHEAWEPSQALSNPSSLEEVPVHFQRPCSVYIFTLALKTSSKQRSSEGAPGLGSSKQSKPEQTHGDHS